MSEDGKMNALKSSTKSLLTQLQNAAATNGDVYVSIIPFSRDVSVDPSYYNANWIDWTDWSAPPANSMPDMSVGPGDNCPYSSRIMAIPARLRQQAHRPTNTIPNSGTYKGYICPKSGQRLGQLLQRLLQQHDLFQHRKLGDLLRP
ncbi:MAG: hypothetical protein WDN48_13540 [Pseudolabrys sp.]